MKDILKILIPIIIVAVITFVLCIIFIKPKVLSIKATKEYEYIQNNKKNIEKVIIRNDAQLGISCYELEINKAYEILNNMEIKKESKIWCSGGKKYLEFYFKDGIKKEFYFDCESLVYDNVYYELEEEILLVNKDEYMPDKITKGMIVVSNEDEIECK